MIEKLFNLREQSQEIVSRFSKIDLTLQTEITDTINRADELHNELARTCKSASGILGKRLLKDSVISSFETEIKSLERIIGKAEETNTKLLSNRADNEFKRLVDTIIAFNDTYGHFLDIWGFVKLSKQDHLTLAQDADGNYLTLSDKDRRTHILQLGRTGKGKSQQLSNWILSDILSGRKRGGLIADPLGSLARNISSFVMAYDNIKQDFIKLKPQILDSINGLFEGVSDGVKSRIEETKEFERFSLFEELLKEDLHDIFPEIKVTLIDLNKRAKLNPYRVNPFSPSKSLTIHESISILLDCIASEMDQRIETTANVKAVLGNLFALIAINDGNINDILFELENLKRYSASGKGLNLIQTESIEKLKASDEPFCRHAASYITDHLLSFKGNQFNELIHSSRSRIGMLLDSPVCNNFFNTQKTTLDLEEIINRAENEREFVVLNIPNDDGSGIVSKYILRLMEKILYNRTDKQKDNVGQNWYMYFDEASRFINTGLSADSMGDKFTSLRQYGGCLSVAIQTSTQLIKNDPSRFVFNSIVESCATKVIFAAGLEDSEHFAKTIFRKGNMLQMSFNCSVGQGETYSVNGSIGRTEGNSKSRGTTNTLSESLSKTLSNTVSQSFSNTQSVSQGRTESNGVSKGNNSSISKGTSIQNKDVTERSSSVIGGSVSFNNSNASNETKGTSTGTSDGASKGTSETNSTSRSAANSVTDGISSSMTETIGAAKALSDSVGFSFTSQPMSITDETALLSEEIMRLDERECFVATDRNTNKSVTLDSLVIKLDRQMAPYRDEFYKKLFEFQQCDRKELLGNITVSNRDNDENIDLTGDPWSVDDVF